MVGDVQGVKTEPELSMLHRANEGKRELELSVQLDVEREKGWKPLAVGLADVVLQLIDFRIWESRMQVNHWTEGQLPGQLKDACADQPVGNIRFEVGVDIGMDDRLLEGHEDVRQSI